MDHDRAPGHRQTAGHTATTTVDGADDPEDLAVFASGITLAYGDHVAIDDATFIVPRGRHTAVIGPNASGKTTLLRAISGLEVPVAGHLRVLDRTGTAIVGRNPMVGHVLQVTTFSDAIPLTVREVVKMGRYAHHGLLSRLRADDHRAVTAAMERMDILDLADRQLANLSGGQEQRVSVAQGLAQEADLLLLDEPVTGLDAPSLQRIRGVVTDELAAGRTVVTTTHDVGDAGLADHVLLVAGTVVASGTPEEVLTQEHLAAAYKSKAFTMADGTIVIGDPHVHGAHHPDALT